MSLLSTCRLSKRYGKHKAVVDLDLTVEEGEIFGLLGPNGAGKTTAISMISGVIKPTSGNAAIGGHDVCTDAHAARRMLGLVPQDLALYEELDARQNLAFFGSLYGLDRATLAERIDWVLGVAGLRERAREPVSRFSGGMKRRLNLAAGLLHKPKLLICDEPTVGVDPQSRYHIFDTLRSLRDEHGMTVLYTSHYMEEVQTLCERVAIMDRGEVVAADTVDGLIAHHGGGSLELEIDGDVDAARAAAEPHGEVSVEGDRVRVVPSGDGYAEVIAAVEVSGARIKSLRTLTADLETVFLTLTGHRLRDD